MGLSYYDHLDKRMVTNALPPVVIPPPQSGLHIMQGITQAWKSAGLKQSQLLIVSYNL